MLADFSKTIDSDIVFRQRPVRPMRLFFSIKAIVFRARSYPDHSFSLDRAELNRVLNDQSLLLQFRKSKQFLIRFAMACLNYYSILTRDPVMCYAGVYISLGLEHILKYFECAYEAYRTTTEHALCITFLHGTIKFLSFARCFSLLKCLFMPFVLSGLF